MIEAGYNWQFAFVEIASIYVWCVLLGRERYGSAAWFHTVGLILHSTGIVIRVVFWGVASLFPGDPDCGVFPQWSCDYRDWLFWSIQVSTAGVALMLRPLLMAKFGRKFWWLPVALVAVSGFVFGLVVHGLT